MSSSVSTQLNAYRQYALDCLIDSDYVGARKHANACLLLISTIPDGQLAGLSSQTWNRTGIVEFLNQVDRLEAAETETTGIVMQAYEYTGRRGDRC
jgi:hypothetical protein